MAHRDERIVHRWIKPSISLTRRFGRGDLVAAMGRTYLPFLFLYRLRGIREPDGYEAFLSGQAP